MKIVKLSAYLQNNIGDDLMVEILLNRYKNVHFWGCRGLQKKTKKLECDTYFDNEDVYSRWGRVNHFVNLLMRNKKNLVYRIVFKQIEKQCICAVAIGGSIYRQLDGQTIQERMDIEEAKKVGKMPFYVIGANFGPFATKEFLDSFYSYFSTCSGVSFRDKKSYELFSDLSIIQHAPDVVFNVPQGTVIDDNQHVLISVINLSKREHLKQYTEDYIKKLAEICEYIVDLGKTPVLTSLCAYEGDEECVNAIYSILNNDIQHKVLHYFYQGDTEEVLELFRKTHFVIATRFHAMVLAMRFGKPLFSVSYEIKMDNILQETKSSAYCSIADIAKLVPQEIYKNGKQIVNVDDYINNASKQFSQLDCLLRKRL